MSTSSHFHHSAHNPSHAFAGRAMGAASIAVGLAELLIPQKIEETMGIPNGENTGVLRILGIRELLHGVDLMAHRNPTPGILARLAGDMLDTAVLAAAAKQTRRPKGLLTILALVAPIVLADTLLTPRLLTD